MKMDILEEIIESATVEELWSLLAANMAEYGFDRLFYGFTRFSTATSFGDPQDLLILSTHNPEYSHGFLEQGLYFHAPLVQWAAENRGACSWGWVADQARLHGLTSDEMKVLEFNRKHGVTAGYTVSFTDVSVRAKGAIGLTAPRDTPQEKVDKIWAEHGREIVLTANVAHLKLICLPYPGARRPLTPRQREVLEWVGDGKTTQDIAQIMGLTPATVEKHLRLARESLNVDTTAQAVLKASFQNQIFMVRT